MHKIPGNIIIRPATLADCPALSVLMNELGYPTSGGDMTTRFTHIVNHPDYRTRVAVINDEVAGMIGAVKGIFYEKNGTCIRIVALVTSGLHRKKGIARMLLADMEVWANESGATTILVNCGSREERRDAHQFYRDRGFTVKSSGYVKSL